MRSSRDNNVDCAAPELPVKLRAKSSNNTTLSVNSNSGRPTTVYDPDLNPEYFTTASSISGYHSNHSSQRSSYVDPSTRTMKGMYSVIEGRDGHVTLRRPSDCDHPPPLPPKKRDMISTYMHSVSSFYQPCQADLDRYRASAITCSQYNHVRRQVEMSFFAERSICDSKYSASSGSDESMWSTSSSLGGNTGTFHHQHPCSHLLSSNQLLPPQHHPPPTSGNSKLVSTINSKLVQNQSVPPLLPPKISQKHKSTNNSHNNHSHSRSTLTANSLPATRSSSPLRGGESGSGGNAASDSGISSLSGGSSPTPVKSSSSSKNNKILLSSPTSMKGPIDSVDVSSWLVLKSDTEHGPEKIKGGTIDALIVKATEKESG